MKKVTQSAIQVVVFLGIATTAFFAVSCASNTHGDQRRSLSKFDTEGIKAPVRLPELKNKPRSNFSAADFLTLHSGLVVSGKYVNQEFKEKLNTNRETNDGTLELGFSIPIAKDGTVFGSCAPVTRDGYFLTAAHVIGQENTYVIYAASDNNRTQLKAAKCRVVFKNKEADFAIIKADVKTPRYLKYRQNPIKPGETLFAGGWMHEKGGGIYQETQSAPKGKDPRFHKVISSVPMIKGDSGSPLIDQSGHLLGMLSTIRVGLVIKSKPYSTAVMMRQQSITGIIREDRMR